MKIKESRGRKIFKAFNYTFLALLGIVTFYPFWYVLIASFNTGRDFMRGGVWIWPRAFTLENYQMAFEDPTIGTSLLISVSATILSIVLGLIVTALAAYALSIKTLPGRSLMNFFWYFTTIFGCGTGTMTEILAEAGYDMIGVDNSGEMLAEAMEKRVESGHDILYLLQDMQEFELYGTVRAVVSVCDSLNYITEEEELEHVFALVNNYLDPQGIFLFDMNTVYKYQTMIGNTTIAENRDEGSFIWENSYDEETGINTYELALFIPREDGLYEKDEEVHYQRAYSLEKIKELIGKAGMELLAVYDAYTLEPPKKDSGRLTFVVREHGK